MKITIPKQDFLDFCLLALREKVEDPENFLPGAIESLDALDRFVNAKSILHYHYLNVGPDLRRKWKIIEPDFLRAGNVVITTLQQQTENEKLSASEKYLCGSFNKEIEILKEKREELIQDENRNI